MFVKSLVKFSALLILIILLLFFLCAYLLSKVKPEQLEQTANNYFKNHFNINVKLHKLAWQFLPQPRISAEHVEVQMLNQQNPFLIANTVFFTLDAKQLLLLNFKSTITSRSLEFHEVPLTQISMQIELKLKKLTMHLNSQYYDGKIQAEFEKLRSANHWQTAIHFQNISVQPIFKQYMPNSKLSLTGRLNGVLNAAADSFKPTEILQTIDGNAQFKITSGTIEGIDFPYLINKAKSIITKTVVDNENTHKTPFEYFDGHATFKDKMTVINIPNIASKHVLITGNGQMNLQQKTLRLNFLGKQANLTETHAIVPIQVSGSFDEPVIQLNTQAISGFLSKDKLKKVSEKTKNGLKKILTSHR